MVTAEMLEGISTAISSNVATILPVAITGFGIMFGVKLVPKLIKMFVR